MLLHPHFSCTCKIKKIKNVASKFYLQFISIRRVKVKNFSKKVKNTNAIDVQMRMCMN
jgi:hypothetical protein